ncbi:hypothetical protein TNCV_4829871 [Trichonephila clavipes]|nr:hypothetical protein TNCV_4829871 [Trichonephila clavipes]
MCHHSRKRSGITVNINKKGLYKLLEFTEGAEEVRAHHKSKFCLRDQDGRISVLLHLGEHTMATCIRHRHIGPSPDIMSKLHLRCVMTLGSTLYSSPVKPYVSESAAGIVRTFLDAENVRLLPWPAHSPYLSPIENVWFMLAE